MGTIIPDLYNPPDVPAGTACPYCWGTGKPFGDGDTPSSIIVNFSGIRKALTWVSRDGEELDGSYSLDNFGSCGYSGLFDAGGITVVFTETATQVWADRPGTIDLFVNFFGNVCASLVMNDSESPFVDGSCLITIPEVEH